MPEGGGGRGRGDAGGDTFGGGAVEGWETVAESNDHVSGAVGGAGRSRDREGSRGGGRADADHVTWGEVGGVLKGARDVGGGGARRRLRRRRRRRRRLRPRVEPYGPSPLPSAATPLPPALRPAAPLRRRAGPGRLARRVAGVRRRGGGASPLWVGGGARERAGETMAGSGAGGGGVGETKVIYHLDEEETPYLVKIPVPAERITLGDFKSVLQRPAGAKYFFKSMDQDFG